MHVRTMFNFSGSLTRRDAALRGVVAFALGLVFLIWPGVTIGTALVLFAVFCLLDASVAGSQLFSAGRAAGDRVLQVLRIVVDVGAAIVAIAWPGPSAEVLTVIIGVYVILLGVLELYASTGSLVKSSGGSGWLIAAGLLSMVAGVLLVAWPNIGAVTLAIVFGAYLASYGAVLLISAAAAPKGATVPDPVT